jgi:hypothetical protein
MSIGLSAVVANAANVTLDFTGIPVGNSVGNYYNGGSSVPGPATGTNYGVAFLVGDASRPGVVTSAGRVNQFIANAAGGFDTGISLDFVNGGVGFRIRIYDTIQTTSSPLVGSQLFTQDYNLNSPFTATPTFSGIGKSVIVEHFTGGLEFDNLQFTNLFQEAAVPEPSTLALAALGLAGLGLVAWRRRGR